MEIKPIAAATNYAVLQKKKGKTDEVLPKVGASNPFPKFSTDARTMLPRALLAPNTREEKISEAREKIREGFYMQPEFLLSLTESLIKFDYA